MTAVRQAITSPRAVSSPIPSAFAPMLMVAQKQPFTRDGWLFEPKLDGMRCIAILRDGHCRLLSRTGRDITHTFPTLASELLQHNAEMILDGEIIAHDAEGKLSFERLQERWLLKRADEVAHAERNIPVSLFAFDLVHVNGFDLTRCTLSERKALLQSELVESARIKRVEHFDDGIALHELCKELGYEGIVAKRANSPYRSAQRTPDWIKIKYSLKDNFVIVGHTEEVGLLIARCDDSEQRVVGAIRYGFKNSDYEVLEQLLQLDTTSPCRRSRSGRVTKRFVPNVVVEVEFMEWTSAGLLRFPVFRSIVSP